MTISEQDKELKQRAKELRKEKKFAEAQKLYEELWAKTQDKYDGVGLLACLRGQGNFEEALPLAKKLEAFCAEFEWCRLEVVWTNIKGEFQRLDDDEPLSGVLQLAQKILSLGADGMALETVVFRVLKAAKKSRDWKTVNDWMLKLDPELLSEEPMTTDDGREGWSKKSVWYNYRINGLIEIGQLDEAILVAEKAIALFPKQRKFLLRLKALATQKKGNLPEAENIFKELCRSPRSDWWLVQEYGKVVAEQRRDAEALQLYCRAALTANKPAMMVNLVADIGSMCRALGKDVEARDNFLLSRIIREENGWSVPADLQTSLSAFLSDTSDSNLPTDSRTALAKCRHHWQALSGQVEDSAPSLKRHLTGRVKIGRPDQPFCFIESKNGESYFCFKDNLPPTVQHGQEVTFDAVPSFDKKKNRETLRASNIRVASVLSQ